MAIIIRLLRVRLSAPPQQLAAYIHSCGVCLNEPKQMIAQPLIIMSESHIKAVSNFCAKNRGMLYIYTL